LEPAQRATVTGRVKFGAENVPLNATITFFDRDRGIALIGFADANGNFTLSPAEAVTGVPAGRYSVSIGAPPPTPEEAKASEETGMPTPTKLFPNLPLKYYNSTTSGLVFEVVPGPNNFEIDVSK
jgi:hypothetical protein